MISAPDRHGIAHWPQVPDLRNLCTTTSYRYVAKALNRSSACRCSLRVVRGAPAGSSCAPLAGIRRQCGDEPALGTGTLAAHNGAQPFEPTIKLPRERLSRPCRCCCAERGPPNVLSAVLLLMPILHDDAAQSPLCARAGTTGVPSSACTYPASVGPLAPLTTLEDEAASSLTSSRCARVQGLRMGRLA